jgi:TPR repeat protein
VQPTASAPTPPAAALAPSREEIAAALKTARQSQGQTEIISQPPVATLAAPPARKLDADTLAGIMNRAKSLMAVGDITSARLLLTRAADAQEASAALLLAQTYDPAVLGTTDMRSITPDPATARSWYERAAQLGSADAQQRLAQMRN